MARILLVTVGGSPQPIMTAIGTLHPDRVIFFCSEKSKNQVLGDGTPCKIRSDTGKDLCVANIPTYLNLGERFQPERDVIIIADPDAPSECYPTITQKIRGLLEEHHEVWADYTGGTKTMGLALGMAAMDYDLKLYLTTCFRSDTDLIQKGEWTQLVSREFIDLDRKIAQFLPIFLRQYNYSGAIMQLKQLSQSIALSTASQNRVMQLLNYCRAFEAWDRFIYHEALELLKPFMRVPKITPVFDFLKRVMHSRAEIDDQFQITRFAGFRYHGYELVEDVVLNAERRERQERYDDAVGRLYRALELLMQIHCFKNYQIQVAQGITRDQLAALLPETARQKYAHRFTAGNDQMQFGIRQGYELLSALDNDPLGQLYHKREKKIAEVRAIRNRSIGAHGFQAIGKDDYFEFKKVVKPFIEEALTLLCPPEILSNPQQFPDAIVVQI